MDNQFKWFCNNMPEKFVFQHNGETYEIPAGSRQLMLAEVAEHGVKRSFALSDPIIDEDGTVVSAGNAVIQRCTWENADMSSPIGMQAPIVIEESKDDSTTLASLSIDPSKPLRPRGRPRRVENANTASGF